MFRLFHEPRIETLEHDLAASEEPQVTVGLAVEPVQVDVAIAAFPIDMRTAEVQLFVLPYDADGYPPVDATRIPGDDANGIGKASDSDLHVLVGAMLRGRVAAAARTVDAPYLDDHTAASLQQISRFVFKTAYREPQRTVNRRFGTVREVTLLRSMSIVQIMDAS